ncbi:hypothetical protein FKM82_029558 [Ascaphus truei]
MCRAATVPLLFPCSTQLCAGLQRGTTRVGDNVGEGGHSRYLGHIREKKKHVNNTYQLGRLISGIGPPSLPCLWDCGSLEHALHLLPPPKGRVAPPRPQDFLGF